MFVQFIITISSIIVLILFFWQKRETSSKNSPPGPIRLPFVGNLLQFALKGRNKMPHEMYHDLRTYGPVVTFNIGALRQVILQDLQIVKDISNSEIWVNRNPNEWVSRRAFGKQLGLVSTSGPVWEKMRKFTIRTLRDFGFGKQKSMEMTIQEELEDLRQRFSHDDKMIHKLLVMLDNVMRNNALGSSVVMLLGKTFPVLQRYVPTLIARRQERLDLFRESQEFFRNILEERRLEGFYKEDQRDFIDVFLCRIDENKNQTTEASWFTDEQFIMVCMDLFMAGSETTSNSIEFAILYMILNPDVQKKVQGEIDSVIGTSRLPSILDMPRMPYTEATLLEVQRFANVLPIVVRCPTKDTSIGEYFIPKGTMGILNYYTIHMDPCLWKNPEEFNPDRFLNESGAIINSNKIMPFGYGRRACIGDQLARTSLFTFFTTFLQKFTFEESRDHPKPTTKPSLGITLAPKPYHAVVTARF